ncbi:Wzz/FepE/Etk N-terminal domain-containing protein [Planktomarina temperata]|nr:Wzz/FepE/Etk N-terminal domain-containing protein [Planktomarina temperata]
MLSLNLLTNFNHVIEIFMFLMGLVMQDTLNSNSDDEIDLRELFITLWAYKFLITCACALGIVFGGYNALNAEKEFTSAAIFKIDQSKSGGISLGGELGALANLAGFGGGIAASILPTDQVTGRIFIEKLDAKLNFQADPYFNTYDPNSIDPLWKSVIKRAVGWKKSSTDPQEAIWQGIVEKYTKTIVLDETPDGAVKIVTTHVNPKRAAEIANTIMDEIISTLENKKNTEQDAQLSYLSNTLAKALSDLEASQSRLKQFALENSALPLESFAARSLQLDGLREQLSRTTELYDAVVALSSMLQNKTTDQESYLELRQQFPIVDQVEFRRVLGQNEIISSWSWPEASSVDAVFDTLTERKNRLQSQINASQVDAERSGLALETYAKLEREAKIAEATYTVMIEQVKAQSMASGYRPDRTEVYEYASPSISPSAPKRSLILALGAALGLFVGAALSLVLALRRGVYYSKNSLIAGAQAGIAASVSALLPVRNKSLNDLNTILIKKPRPVLRDLAVEIHKSSTKQVVVTASRTKLTGNDVARALAIYMQSDTVNVAVVDFSSRAKKLDVNNDGPSVGSFVVAESVGHVSILRPDGDLTAMELLSQRGFYNNINSINSTFDLVFFSADDGDAISLLRALEGQKMFHITLARTKKTKSATLAQMRSLLPIQGLLYD